MKATRHVGSQRRQQLAGSVLTPVRWAVVAGILASLRIPFEVPMHRAGLLAVVGLYAGATTFLSYFRPRSFPASVRERSLLVADLLFSAAVSHLSGGVRSPYFGLWSLAMIRTGLVMKPWASLGVGTAAAALIAADQLVLLGGQRGLASGLSVMLSKLSFLPLIAWAAGRLAQELWERESARREAEWRADALEVEEERTRREMEIARHVQERLLPPTLPACHELTLATLSCPARPVGGDVYDLLELPDGRLLIAIADVSGKGVPAALLTVAIQQGIRQFAGPDPAAVLAGVNTLLLKNTPDEMFATAVCLVVDPREGSVVAATAGHPSPLIWHHATRQLEPLGGRGIALGLLPEWSGLTERWRLASGDALFLYTDGVVDAKLDDEHRLGEEHLIELLGRTPPEDAQEWIGRVREALDGCVTPDDVTAVAVMRC